MDIDKDPKIVYIAGSSRCGSTLLDLTLGSLSGVMSIGEVRRLPQFISVADAPTDDKIDGVWEQPRVCTCGSLVKDCDFWKDVLDKNLGDKLVETSRIVNSKRFTRMFITIVFIVGGRSGLRFLSKFSKNVKLQIDFGDACVKVYKETAEQTGVQTVVDSSKMAYHYMLVSAAAKNYPSLLYVVRDGRAVSMSMIKGARRYFFGDVTESRSIRLASDVWRKTNVLALIVFLKVPRSKRIFLRYEDFCSSPDKKIDEITTKFGLPSYTDEKNIGRHNIGGSPSRHKFKFASITLDDTWRASFSKLHAENFGFLNKILNKFLGYSFK